MSAAGGDFALEPATPVEAPLSHGIGGLNDGRGSDPADRHSQGKTVDLEDSARLTAQVSGNDEHHADDLRRRRRSFSLQWNVSGALEAVRVLGASNRLLRECEKRALR